MKKAERIPRLCLGDPLRECLAYARRKMIAARKAAQAGDRIAAGTLTAQAHETGVACMPEAPRSMNSESAESPRRIWQKLALSTIPDPEREANRTRWDEAESERQAAYYARESSRREANRAERYRGAA